MEPQSPSTVPRPRRKKRVWRLIFFAVTALIVILAILYGHPAFHIARVIWNDRDERHPLPPNTVDDASRLNQVQVESVISVPADPQAAEAQLQSLLLRARREHLKIAIAGARHSEGGHTIYPGGIALNMLPFDQMTLDPSAGILHVGAGALWADIIPFLDSRGFSVAVMQSFNDFSIGGTLSVNAHGWVYGCPPVASTVQSLRVMMADGRIVVCSRANNPEFFSLVLGGYGLFGIILDADLRVVPNARYRVTRSILPASGLPAGLRALDAAPPAMFFARLNIAPKAFLDEAILSAFYPESGPIPPLVPRAPGLLVRAVYRGAEASDYGKELRWDVEKWRDEENGQTSFSRNQLLNEPFANYENRHAASTDILQEFFLPPDEMPAFLADLKAIVPAHRADLINATLRDVRRDDTTFLRYANTDMLALVLLFVEAATPAGEADMQAVTREAIAAALHRHGTYYLPYRLHALPEQVIAAYPMAGAFFALKRRYDPDEIFQNEFYIRYGAAFPSPAAPVSTRP